MIARGSCGGRKCAAHHAMRISVTSFPTDRRALLYERRRAQIRARRPREDLKRALVYRSSRVALGIALDMRAELADRAEPDGSVRELGLDRAIGVERIGHAVDNPGLQDGSGGFGGHRLGTALLHWGGL